MTWAAVLKALPYVIMALVFIIAWYWDRKYRLPNLEGRVENLEKVSHEQEVTKIDLTGLVTYQDLYDPETKLPRYQPVTECGKMHTQYEKTVCSKIDELKKFVIDKVSDIGDDLNKTHNQLQLMDQKREDTRADVVEVMTRVETMLEDKKKNEIAEIAKAVAQEIIKNGK